MKILINDKNSNLVATVKSKVCPHVGDTLFLKSLNKMLLVKEVFYQFDDDDSLDFISVYVVENEEFEMEATEKWELPQWLQTAY